MSVRIQICCRPQGPKLRLPTSTNYVTMRVLKNSLTFSATKGGRAPEGPASEVSNIPISANPKIKFAVNFFKLMFFFFYLIRKKQTSLAENQSIRKKCCESKIEFKAFEFGSAIALPHVISNFEISPHPSQPMCLIRQAK